MDWSASHILSGGELSMRNPERKSLSVLMIIVTTIGLLLSLFFIIQIWRLRQPVTTKLQSGVAQTSAILRTTSEGLDVIELVVNNIYSSTLYLDDTTIALADTLDSTDSFIDSAGQFVGVDLINTITNTQKTLESAKSSALVIDNIMSTLSRIPLLGINYNPSQALNTALGKVSESLDPFQGSLKSFQTNLNITRKNMQVFNDQLVNLDKNIRDINNNLDASRKVIDKYQSQVKILQTWMDEAGASLPKWVRTTCWILTLIIMWLVLIQASILIQAFNRLSNPPESP